MLDKAKAMVTYGFALDINDSRYENDPLALPKHLKPYSNHQIGLNPSETQRRPKRKKTENQHLFGQCCYQLNVEH